MHKVELAVARRNGAVPLELVYQWRNNSQLLFAQYIAYRNKVGAVLYYENPPVHQINTEALTAYQRALDRIQSERQAHFLILLSPSDPVHAGGDLKETLKHLECIEVQRQGNRLPQDDTPYAWADERLHKAFELYKSVRKLAARMPVIAVCNGGVRYGGSAEIPLWADYIVGDSRSAMCFSEATIGLIPGWGGVGRLISKAGYANACYMAYTGRHVSADDLIRIGVYDAIGSNDFHTLAAAFSILSNQPLAGFKRNRGILVPIEDVMQEVRSRGNLLNFTSFFGKSPQEVSDIITARNQPLAPQSIAALNDLFRRYNEAHWNEESFIEYEMHLDARLYRDARLREGIRAALEGRVADFRNLGATGVVDQ